MELNLGTFEVAQMSLIRRADGDVVSATFQSPTTQPGQVGPQVTMMNMPQGPTPRVADTIRLGKQYEIILREVT